MYFSRTKLLVARPCVKNLLYVFKKFYFHEYNFYGNVNQRNNERKDPTRLNSFPLEMLPCDHFHAISYRVTWSILTGHLVGGLESHRVAWRDHKVVDVTFEPKIGHLHICVPIYSVGQSGRVPQVDSSSC